MRYIFDESGSVTGIGIWTAGSAQWTDYYFVKNLQGDVIEVYGKDNTLAASYTYDAWGNILTKSGDLADLNPFRYRTYYFDNETWFYYLQSRYYDPAIGRFINADAFAATGQGLLGNNMFAYCNNNPVNYFDPAGFCALHLTNRPDNRVSYMAMCGCDSGGEKTITPNVGDGNYYGFDKNDLFSQHKSEMIDISREQANTIYHEIEVGDYAYMVQFPIVSSLFSLFKGNIAESASLLYDVGSSVNGMLYSQTYDPQGRLLYIEEGYTVVIIERVYIGKRYSAAEREYFLFDQNMHLQYNDVVRISYFVD